MNHTRKSRALAAAAGTLSATLGAPLCVLFLVVVVQAWSYEGLCGPYPTDIPAYPCAIGDYMVGLFEPFAAAGMLVIASSVAMLTFVVAALVSVVWVVRTPRPRA